MWHPHHLAPPLHYSASCLSKTYLAPSFSHPQQDDTLIMDMKITDVAGFTPLPGLSGERIAFDPDQDPLGLAPVSDEEA